MTTTIRKTVLRQSLWCIGIFVFIATTISATPYPDQQYILEGADSLLYRAAELQNIIATDDSTGIRLDEEQTAGYLIVRPQQSAMPFDICLPSWNGTVPDNQSGFRIFIRVPNGPDWSPWLEVGYWKDNTHWPGEKTTRYSGGRISIDTGIFYSYHSSWQFKIELKRVSTSAPSPSVRLLSMALSDSEMESSTSLSDLVNDKPAPLYIDTHHLFQSELSDEYGHRICSPTSASMVLLSYGIEVDPLQFAMDNLDPYYQIFGIWPRTVQNASGYGVRGTVNRYRTWSEARPVLNSGGRIVMSLGDPLYPNGHLVMLAGFDDEGLPIVHDPALKSGHAYKHNKTELSQSWFKKGGGIGGVAYTFTLRDSAAVTGIKHLHRAGKSAPADHIQVSNYPNPFNSQTTFVVSLNSAGSVQLIIYDLLGRQVAAIPAGYLRAGVHHLPFNMRKVTDRRDLSSGLMLYHLYLDGKKVSGGKLLYLK